MQFIDVHSDEHAEFKQTLLDIYVPRYGAGWAEMLDSDVWYARIDPRRMFTFWMPES